MVRLSERESYVVVLELEKAVVRDQVLVDYVDLFDLEHELLEDGIFARHQVHELEPAGLLLDGVNGRVRAPLVTHTRLVLHEYTYRD